LQYRAWPDLSVCIPVPQYCNLALTSQLVQMEIAFAAYLLLLVVAAESIQAGSGRYAQTELSLVRYSESSVAHTATYFTQCNQCRHVYCSHIAGHDLTLAAVSLLTQLEHMDSWGQATCAHARSRFRHAAQT
jgi:hypothetical protein